MRAFLEKIQRKPEGARRMWALVWFCVIGAGIGAIGYWNMTGALTKSGITQSARDAKEMTMAGYQYFQEFRNRLGIIKYHLNQIVKSKTVTKELLDSLSSYESETVGQPRDEMTPAADIPSFEEIKE